MDEHLSCYYFLVAISNVAVNIPVLIFVWVYVLINLGNRIGKFMFNFFEKLSNCLPEGHNCSLCFLGQSFSV